MNMEILTPPSRVNDLRGKKFAKLRVLAYVGNDIAGALWKCRCDCGRYIVVRSSNLRSGNSKSCGCSRIKHGLCHHKAYSMWQSMLRRCAKHPRYAGRGIQVCKSWRKFENFYKWYATQEPIPSGYTLDRRDNDGNYTPSNCRFVSVQAQLLNREVSLKGS